MLAGIMAPETNTVCQESSSVLAQEEGQRLRWYSITRNSCYMRCDYSERDSTILPLRVDKLCSALC